MADLDGIRSRLEGIADELRDAAYEALRDAAADGRTSEEEKRLSRARRAVERAATTLGHDPLDGS